MAYTARWNEPGVAVGLAKSSDLNTWEKHSSNPITRIDEQYYETTGSGVRKISHWRDPFLFQENDYVYHYVCASRNSGPSDGRGTVGVARTKDMTTWEILSPPEIDPVVQELECPQVHREGEKCLLLFSSFYELFSKHLQLKHGKNKLTNSMYCMKGESVFGPFRFEVQDPIIPVDNPVQPYAGQIVRWKGSTYILGTVWNDKQDYICDPIEVYSDGTTYRLTSN